jgi:hypothetical protein
MSLKAVLMHSISAASFVCALTATLAFACPCAASGSGDWSEVGPSLARVGSALLPELTLRFDENASHTGMAWEFPLVFSSCDPRFCNQSGTDLEPKTNFQLSTVPAFRWYPGIGTVGNRLTQRFWLFTNDLDWNPAVGIGAGWFHHGTSHGPVGELRLWVGDVMFGSVTRGRSVGFFAAASAERAIDDDRFRLEIAAGIEAPIYVGN